MSSTMLEDALSCSELAVQLGNIVTDDKVNLTDLSLETILNEADYLLEKYSNSSWMHHGSLLAGHQGKENQDLAIKEVNEINEFLDKWDNRLPQKRISPTARLKLSYDYVDLNSYDRYGYNTYD